MEGALVSSAGDFMQNIAQSWLVWHVSKSPVAIGVVAFFDTFPRLLVGALGGAIADRFDRRRVLMITQTAAMIQAIVYWLAVEFDVIQLWHIAALAFFLGVVNTINQTARQSLVSSLVPKDELLNAIGLQSSVFNFSKILGPSAGGIIIAYVGLSGCFLINAISFVFLLFNLYQMELPPWEKRPEQQTLWADVKEGFNYLLGNRRLLYIVGLSYVIATFCAPYNRFVPDFCHQCAARRRFGIRLADGRAGSGRDGGGLGACFGQQTAGGNQLDLLLRRWFCPLYRVVRLFPLFRFVVFLSGAGRLLPNRRSRPVEYRDPNLDTAQSSGTGPEFIFYGPGTLVAGQRNHRRRGRRHRHGVDLYRVRRDHRGRRAHAADRKPEISR